MVSNAIVSCVIFFLFLASSANCQSLFADAPADNQILSGTVVFSGWAIDASTGIAAISFSVDGTDNAVANYGSTRTDVCAAVGQYPGCPNVGWSAGFDTTQISNGPHSLAISAITSDGRKTTILREFNTANSGTGAVFEIVNKLSAKVLDVTGGSSNNGTLIQQWDFNGSPWQKWLLIPTDSGYYQIASAYTGKVLDITGVSTSDGALIQEYEYLGGQNQQWTFFPTGDGFFEIVSRL